MSSNQTHRTAEEWIAGGSDGDPGDFAIWDEWVGWFIGLWPDDLDLTAAETAEMRRAFDEAEPASRTAQRLLEARGVSNSF